MKYLYILDNSVVTYPDDPYLQLGMLNRKKLRPQCHQLLVLLMECKQLNSTATYEMIGDALWSEDGGWGPDKKQSLKDCVGEINRIYDCIENVRGIGYVLSSKVLKVPTVPVFSMVRETTRGWTEYAVENLQLKELEISRQLEYITLLITNLLKDIEDFNNSISSAEQATASRIIGHQLFTIKYTAEAFQTWIPGRWLELKTLSKETQNIVSTYKKIKDNYDHDFNKRLRDAKHEFDDLLNWCLEAKIELDRDRMILSEYQDLRDKILEG